MTTRPVDLLADSPVPAKGRVRQWFPPTRRTLQIGLGAIWLLDVALQFQPYMFTRTFVTQTIVPATRGNPPPVVSSMTWASNVMAHHIAVYNVFFATIQLAIAVGLFWRRSAKAALAASVIWSLGVWWFGEGFGGVLGGASPLMAPGAVILYAFAALLFWPTDEQSGRPPQPSLGTFRGHALKWLWLLLWGTFAYLLLLPANRGANALSGLLNGMTTDEPSWIQSFDRSTASMVNGDGALISVLLAGVCIMVSVCVFYPSLIRLGLVLAMLFGVAVWLAQDLGGILTSQGTDPNSGPVLVFLALGFWPGRHSTFLDRPLPAPQVR